MRKDVKVIVAVACLVLVGLLAYVLFAPSEKAGDLATNDETTGTDTTNVAPAPTDAQPTIPTTPPVEVALTPPATQPTSPSISVALGGATTQPAVIADPIPTLPASDTGASANTPSITSGPTDWSTTLNTGTVATATGSAASTSNSAGGIPTNTLIGFTDPAKPTNTSPAGTTTGAPSAPAAAGAKTHKVVFGETLSSIAADHYGNKATYAKIVAANPSVNPNRLKVGTVLTIPALTSEAETASGTKAASGNTYVIKSGDSLQKIAAKLYGSSDKWTRIYELNRAAIGGDPHRLKAGMTIKLPDSPTTR
jgi:nucleoid-associated protein YgaU